ncbi:hypothetical protein VE00_03931 [Pseudogymnoascus sp. WSF 3629]|nr:hypothetical protein VE00_03931 [Pseudogymnoascus sp. WSF 3629]
MSSVVGKPGGAIHDRTSEKENSSKERGHPSSRHVVRGKQARQARGRHAGVSTTEGEEVDGPGFELEQREGGGAPGGRAGYGRQDPSSAVVTRRAVVGVAAGVARVWEAGRRAARLMCVVVGVMPAQVADENGLLLYAVALLVGGGAHIDAVLVVDTAADGEALDETVTHDDGCESGFEVLWFGNIRRR